MEAKNIDLHPNGKNNFSTIPKCEAKNIDLNPNGKNNFSTIQKKMQGKKIWSANLVLGT